MDYSLHTLVDRYHVNRKAIEDYRNSPNQGTPPPLIEGISIGIFLSMLIFSLLLWVVALLFLLNHWNELPGFAQFIGFLGIFPGVPFGALQTILVVYLFKKTN